MCKLLSFVCADILEPGPSGPLVINHAHFSRVLAWLIFSERSVHSQKPFVCSIPLLLGVGEILLLEEDRDAKGVLI